MVRLRLAVMSDLHVDETENNDTRMFVEPGAARIGQYPMSDLDRLIRQESIQADYLLLPGDTANKANAQGLQYGWRRAHAAAQSLGAKLVATSGNHDVVTHAPSADRSQMLKNLLPSFPTGNQTLDQAYWTNGWCVLEEDDHRVLVLDSTAGFPPYPAGPTVADEDLAAYFHIVDRGSLRPNVEQELEAYLERAPEKLSIALIHHHPIEHQLRAHLQDSYGPMQRGGELMNLLTAAYRTGRWLLVHGHKHIPQIASAATVSANGPLVFCSGSLGAKLWAPIDTITRNQFHVIEVESHAAGLALAGSVESYTWGVGFGWYRSGRRGSGLPGRAGFGSSADPRAIGARIDAIVPAEPGTFVHRPELVAAIPEVQYIMPVDEEVLEDIMRGFGLSVMRSASGEIASVVREVPSV